MLAQPVEIALSAMSSLRWYFSSWGGSTHWCSPPAAAPTARFRRPGSRRSSRSHPCPVGQRSKGPMAVVSVGRRVVPFAEGRRLVAVVAQDFGHRGGGLAGSRRCSRPSPPPVRRWSRSDPLVVAPGKQRGPCGRADRRGVKSVVADALLASRTGWAYGSPAEGVRLTEADIVEQNDEDVRGVLGRRFGSARRLCMDSCNRRPGDAGRGGRRKGRDAPVPRWRRAPEAGVGDHYSRRASQEVPRPKDSPTAIRPIASF